ncbi:hypothetical protein A3752_03430 [Oleiphilus sp. HI0081]|nr:hypothetical protein A3729_27240 [Oleiphilus sp. HI0043]KZY46015.1 hypothetical protein A3732_08455 [Oleiphilus sp. HI0050]KZY65227.1 hypothetical protein A3735_08225 [Oleiphilus sp. HI0061]KZY73195.1 hypothetical protein A3740_03620 [Oleiphilus sp. HI0068]KZY79873.1 hypothetical protein A3741_00870 [Oleiphilus sp. HI0069]KZY89111.1 hypothetical protein A3743_09190 [Oleiphilus sp. HI0072]KZZ12408.1 hypothetical protein A3749_06370 [Oleiphilus sp. HI0078]KZZ29001.1 hypothetical protein A37
MQLYSVFIINRAGYKRLIKFEEFFAVFLMHDFSCFISLSVLLVQYRSSSIYKDYEFHRGQDG